MSRGSGLRLITVRFSHFCEKARWALDRAGLEYVEQSHVPILSWPFTFGAGGGRTVPVLVTPGEVLSDSTDILRWIDGQPGVEPLFPAGAVGDDAAALEAELDRRFGPATRRVAYQHIMSVPGGAEQLLASAGPRWQARLTPFLYPAMKQVLVRGMKLSPAAAERSRGKIDEVFADVARRLADGRRYLCGDRFTAADLTFASLAVPVIQPDYCRQFLPGLEAPAALTSERDRLRATPAGRFALRMYEQERAPVERYTRRTGT
jgi:glutathione S-transferase